MDPKKDLKRLLKINRTHIKNNNNKKVKLKLKRKKRLKNKDIIKVKQKKNKIVPSEPKWGILKYLSAEISFERRESKHFENANENLERD